MTYPSQWQASTDPNDPSGTATFTINAVEHRLRLANFDNFMTVSQMLELAFQQGKQFGASGVADYVAMALNTAKNQLGL